MHKNGLPGRIGRAGALGLLLAAGNIYSQTQAAGAPAAPPPDAMTDAVRQLQDEVRELRNAVLELRSEAGQYRAETEQLRKELESRPPAQEASAVNSAGGVSAPAEPAALGERVSTLEESSDLLTSKLDDQYQTKVEAASKYRLRLSGIVLL